MNKKLMSALYVVLGIVLTVLAFSIMPSYAVVPVANVQAAPLGAGDTPLYDSGWFSMTNPFDWITHSLDAIPTDFVVLVSDGSAAGNFVTEASPRFFIHGNGKEFGYSVTALCKVTGEGTTHQDYMKIYWAPDGVAWSNEDSRWFERGEDVARVIIFAADNVGGCPYRP
jgi:hypothetical protein